MLPRDTVRGLLRPFEISLAHDSLDRMIVYLELLLRWNQKINLTSIRTAEQCVTRHFGESLLLSRLIRLEGRLLDIGSGAGFPGLAIKLIAPDLEVVLLEPVAKKRAFLKEVIRTCRFGGVNVLATRLQDFSDERQGSMFDIITIRAVGGLLPLISQTNELLNACGRLCLWVGSQQVQGIRVGSAEFRWLEPVGIPLSHDRQILQGTRECQASK